MGRVYAPLSLQLAHSQSQPGSHPGPLSAFTWALCTCKHTHTHMHTHTRAHTHAQKPGFVSVYSGSRMMSYLHPHHLLQGLPSTHRYPRPSPKLGTR